MLDGVETTVNVETPSAMTVAEFASKALETATKLDSLVQSRPGVVHVAGMRNDCLGSDLIQLVAGVKEDKISGKRFDSDGGGIHG